MRARVVHESLFGNTQQIAQAIARGLSSTGEVAVEIVEVAQASIDLTGLDLLVVGGPVHAWSMSRASTRTGARDEAQEAGVALVSQGEGIRDWLARLQAHPDNLRAATFDTAMRMPRWFPVGSAARPAARQLAQLRIPAVTAAEHFWVVGKHGPLDEGEEERAEAWGAGLRDACLAAYEGTTSSTQTLSLSPRHITSTS